MNAKNNARRTTVNFTKQERRSEIAELPQKHKDKEQQVTFWSKYNAIHMVTPWPSRYNVVFEYLEVEGILLEAIKGRRLKPRGTHPHTIESIKSLIDLYKACNKSEKANQWRVKLPQIEAVDE